MLSIKERIRIVDKFFHDRIMRNLSFYEFHLIDQIADASAYGYGILFICQINFVPSDFILKVNNNQNCINQKINKQRNKKNGFLAEDILS